MDHRAAERRPERLVDHLRAPARSGGGSMEAEALMVVIREPRTRPTGALRPAVRGGGRWQAWGLAAVELLVAWQAFSGGRGLMTDTWDMPRELLVRTPFDDWVGPGWCLVLLIGLPHLVAGSVTGAASRWPRAELWSIVGGQVAGASLLVWIVVQLVLLRVFFFLQPVAVALGLLEIALARSWRLRRAGASAASSRSPRPG
ncbi:hypothetical protein [Nostocoides japonicum]|uniref:hypothetical protein n=1 Tax=Nostocoides japonicum TaxID=99481 RepID=UPI001910CD29|nr:hypothetical protein [Tetrasphaera japonica]